MTTTFHLNTDELDATFIERLKAAFPHQQIEIAVTEADETDRIMANTELRDRIATIAAGAGIHLRRRLRLGLATDGLIALKAGYRSAALGSITEYKLPLNYHSPNDTADRLHYDPVADAAALCEALVRDSAAATPPTS